MNETKVQRLNEQRAIDAKAKSESTLRVELWRGDKAIVSRVDGKDLFNVRIDPDGGLFFEFDRAITLELNASNCFVARFRS